MKFFKKNNKKGFTLVELIVVIAILAILALILVPAITGYVGKANESKNEANARALYSEALILYTEDETITEQDMKNKLNTLANSFDKDAKVIDVTLPNEDGSNELTITYQVGDGKEFVYPKNSGN